MAEELLLLKNFLAHDRRALAKVITLLESEKEEDFLLSSKLLSELIKIPHHSTIRIAISGPPGVGKSTFINALGEEFLNLGNKVAVLPIDPSSELSHGSLLADKTRMSSLLMEDKAYIRPSPSRALLGGVAISTKDVMLAVEAFGFNVVIIETIGVGQSETLAWSLVDHFVLLMQPGAGDELQAMKKGNLELADFVLVNKMDGEHEELAKKTLASLGHIVAGGVSALSKLGVKEFLATLQKRHEHLLKTKQLINLRKTRLVKFFAYVFEKRLLAKVKKQPSYEAHAQNIIDQVSAESLPLKIGVEELLGHFGIH